MPKPLKQPHPIDQAPQQVPHLALSTELGYLMLQGALEDTYGAGNATEPPLPDNVITLPNAS